MMLANRKYSKTEQQVILFVNKSIEVSRLLVRINGKDYFKDNRRVENRIFPMPHSNVSETSFFD